MTTNQSQILNYIDKQLSKVDAPYFKSGLPLASVGRLFGPNGLFQPSCLEGVTLGSGFVPKANAELQTPCIIPEPHSIADYRVNLIITVSPLYVHHRLCFCSIDAGPFLLAPETDIPLHLVGPAQMPTKP